MSLRRSPLRTAAFLAANRSNALRSTGPRTPEGKGRSALNALKHGGSAQKLGELLAGREAQEFLELRRALWEAIIPTNGFEQEAVNRLACRVWTVRRETQRRVATPAGRAHYFHGGAFPRPWRQRVRRRGWKLSVSVWLRRGRASQGHRVARPAYGWREGQGRLHTVVTVTASMGHPEYRLQRSVHGWMAPRMVFKTKPEYYRNGRAWKYNIHLRNSGTAAVESPARRARSRLLPGRASGFTSVAAASAAGRAAPRPTLRAVLGKLWGAIRRGG